LRGKRCAAQPLGLDLAPTAPKGDYHRPKHDAAQIIASKEEVIALGSNVNWKSFGSQPNVNWAKNLTFKTSTYWKLRSWLPGLDSN
jgi:hypothetical protein